MNRSSTTLRLTLFLSFLVAVPSVSSTPPMPSSTSPILSTAIPELGTDFPTETTQPQSAPSKPTTQAPDDNSTCEEITINDCSNMPYNLTQYPNMLGDQNQTDAEVTLGYVFTSLKGSGSPAASFQFMCLLAVPPCQSTGIPKIPCKELCVAGVQILMEQGFNLTLGVDCSILPPADSGKCFAEDPSTGFPFLENSIANTPSPAPQTEPGTSAPTTGETDNPVTKAPTGDTTKASTEGTTKASTGGATKPATGGAAKPAEDGTKAAGEAGDVTTIKPDNKAAPSHTSYKGPIIGLFIFLMVTSLVFAAIYLVRKRKLRNNYGRLDEDSGEAGWSAFSKNPIYRGDRDYQPL